eukprot:scaffold32260_cov132-Isochrysis_galbana.AAC.3
MVGLCISLYFFFLSSKYAQFLPHLSLTGLTPPPTTISTSQRTPSGVGAWPWTPPPSSQKGSGGGEVPDLGKPKNAGHSVGPCVPAGHPTPSNRRLLVLLREIVPARCPRGPRSSHPTLRWGVRRVLFAGKSSIAKCSAPSCSLWQSAFRCAPQPQFS